MSRNTIIGLVVVLVILAGWYYIQSQKGPGYTQPTVTPRVSQPKASPATAAASPSKEVSEKNVVTITSSGFKPNNITIKTGESVTWVNQDSKDHQVQSAVHPTHRLYPPLNTVGLIKPGEKKSLTFPQAGNYKYHDHLNPTLSGSVTVE